MNNNELIKWCTSYFTEILTPLNYEVVEVEYKKDSIGNLLCFYIDRMDDDIISVEDCEYVSKIISDKLDEVDPISDSYYLEVSSPGLEREFRFPKDYRRNLQQKVCVKLYGAIENKKEWTGILKDFDEQQIVLLINNKKEIIIERDKIASIKLSLF